MYKEHDRLRDMFILILIIWIGVEIAKNDILEKRITIHSENLSHLNTMAIKNLEIHESALEAFQAQSRLNKKIINSLDKR